MLSLDDSGGVVYASSFSKTVCPGIRVGYLVGPAALIDDLRALATNTYISPNMVAQSIVHRFCVSGRLDRSIATVKAALAERVTSSRGARARAARGALRRARRRLLHVGRAARGDRRRRPLPRGPGARRPLRKGTDFLLEGGRNTLRLAYSGVTPDEIAEGVTRLASAVRAVEASTPA